MIDSTQWAATDDHDPIDQILADFESDWRLGRRPRIESYLEKTGPVDPIRLFETLLVSELLHRERLGETVDGDEYRQRFPGLAASVAPCVDRARIEASGRSWNLGTETGAEASYGTADHRPDETSNGSANGSGVQDCRYEKLREHAQGNLGKVYVARDAELNREVALKEIQSRHADRIDSRLRFILEGEVTGRLDHPGIVPVHGLGQYANGRPFYAMRFVRGETLKEAIKQAHCPEGSRSKRQNPALRSLVARLVDTGHAIAYAHSRGIIHRDIKPDNILLGPFGETLVVDWGLALPIARSEGDDRAAEGTLEPSSEAGSAHDRTGSILGTPAYMSPEQAAGELGELGPRSDVYNLGATLYCVLTGQPPFTGRDVHAILKAVRAGDFSRPRALRANVPKPLEAICLKSMALRPLDRYAGARELTQDLQRWLDDEPIQARREPWAARIGRWSRRNQAVVTGIVAVGFSAIVGITIHDRVVASDRFRERANGARSRDTIRFMLNELAADDLAYIPGSEQVRHKLASRAVNDLLQFLAESPEDPSLRSDIADAHRELANIERWMGQNLSPRVHYQHALIQLRWLSDRSPEDRGIRVRLAAVTVDLGESLRMGGKLDQAEAEFHQAFEMIEPDLNRDPGDPNLRRTKACALLDLSNAMSQMGDYSRSWHSGERSVALFSELVGGKNDSDTKYRIAGLITLGATFIHLKEWARAHQVLDDASKQARELIALSERDAIARCYLAVTLYELGQLQVAETGRHEMSIADYRSAVELLTPLVSESSSVPLYRWTLARAKDAFASSLAETGEITEAISQSRQARRLLEKLHFEHRLPEYLSNLAENRGNFGRIVLRSGNPTEAVVLFHEAIVLQQKAMMGRPGFVNDRPLISRHQADLERALRLPIR